MSVTDEILKKTDFKFYSEGHWDKDIPQEDPSFNWAGFHSFNDAGLEVETGELIYAFTRILKPDHVLETGTHWGVGACYIGLALRDNLKGHLDTLEFLKPIHDRAKSNLRALELEEWVDLHLTDATTWTPQGYDFDLILLDTEPQTRFKEFLRYDEYLKPGGYMFIHDLHRHQGQVDNEEHGYAWPWGKLPDQMVKWVKSGKYRPFHFATPRGLTGYYKVHPDDFKW